MKFAGEGARLRELSQRRSGSCVNSGGSSKLSSFAAKMVSTVNRYLHARSINTRIPLQTRACNARNSTVVRPRFHANVWLVNDSRKRNHKEFEGVGSQLVRVRLLVTAPAAQALVVPEAA